MKKTIYNRATCIESSMNRLPEKSVKDKYYTESLNQYLLKPMIFLILVLTIFSILADPALGGGDHSGECSDEVELMTLRNSLITEVETNEYSGTIHYMTEAGQKKVLKLGNPGDKETISIVVRINGISAPLTSLEGKRVSELRSSRINCHFSHPVLRSWQDTKWIVQARL